MTELNKTAMPLKPDDYFLVNESFVEHDVCDKLIALYQVDKIHKSVDVRKVSNVDKIIHELLLSDARISKEWSPILNNLVEGVTGEIGNYLKKFNTIGSDHFKYSHTTFWEQEELKHAPFHYDSEFVIEKNEEDPARNFLCLLYLNDDYDSGELIFPLQGKVIKPKKGMLVIFPTSFMFPHMTTPSIGNDRFLMRFAYYLDKEKKKELEGY